MKIAMKGDMGDADEMALLVCRTARAAHVIAHEACQNTLICRLFWLEVKDCNENRHEGVFGCCRPHLSGSANRGKKICKVCQPPGAF